MKKTLIVLLLSALMVLSPAVGAFATTEGLDNAEANNVESVETETSASEDTSADATTQNESSEDEQGNEDVESVPEENPVEASTDQAENEVNTDVNNDNSDKGNSDKEEPSTEPSAEKEESRNVKGDDECTHSNTYESNYNENYYYYDYGDNYEHQATYDRIVEVYCNDCGARLSRDLETITENEPHTYEDGVCIYCGHENSCEHPNMQHNPYIAHERATYEEIEGDNKNHLVSGPLVEYYNCPDCGYGYEEDLGIEDTQEEAHWYVDGVCQSCGHENACEHSNIEKSTYINQSAATYEQIEGDNRNHLVSGPLVEYYNCPDCGYGYEEDLGIEDTQEEAHWFVDGVCQACGYENQCKHLDIQHYTHIDDERATYEEIEGDNRNHLVSGPLVESYYCPDCGYGYEEDLGIEDTQEEAHRYVDGVCQACGYENQCEHPNMSSDIQVDRDRATYEQLEGDNLHHLISGPMVRYSSCPDCSYYEYEDLGEEDTQEEGHWFVDGVCQYCGYENQCKHPDIQHFTHFDFERTTFEEIEGDNRNHLVSGPLVEYYNCPDCGESYEEDLGVEDTQEDAHFYVDGVCQSCGHLNTCTHPNMEEGMFIAEYSTFEDIPGNNKYHIATGPQIKYSSCPDCGYYYTESTDTIGSEEDAHTYDNGVCQECGHVNMCKHTGSTSTHYEYEDVDVAPIDAKKHSVTGEIVKATVCDDCGECIILEELGNTTIYEDHDWDEDCCWICGYERSYNTGWNQDEDGSWCYYDDSGNIVTGWQNLDDDWYYFNPSTGKQAIGWEKIGKAWYYFDEDEGGGAAGYMVVGGWLVTKEDKVYCFDGSGAWLESISGWHKDVRGDWYYLDKGVARRGWQQIGGTWYFFHGKWGDMLTGWQKLGGKKYYFNSSGAMLTGWQQVNGTWYYFNNSGATVTGWQQLGGVWYYFDDEGAMLNGWQPLGSVWYYFKSGAMVTGWQQISGTWYYFNENGAMLIGWQQINGTWYYFNGSGAMVTGWQQINGTWYYFKSGAMVTGWQQLSGTWYYFNNSGAMVTGWQQLSGTWYYFNGSGAMVTGWQQINGTWYYFKSGAMLTGWQPISGTWYYFNGSGAMLTGTQRIGGRTYVFNSDGSWTGR